jgi:hypothetical protein
MRDVFVSEGWVVNLKGIGNSLVEYGINLDLEVSCVSNKLHKELVIAGKKDWGGFNDRSKTGVKSFAQMDMQLQTLDKVSNMTCLEKRDLSWLGSPNLYSILN